MSLDTNRTVTRPNLNPASFPLSGTRLIEASAGTGKTYQIANLYVRLVLGLDKVNKEPLPVEKILVVTFTRAATSELRGRIRARLEEVLHVFREAFDEEHEEGFINQIKLSCSKERIRSIKLLNDAILSMDEASISTIHSFAVQAAKTFLFETGALADIQISESGNEAKTQLLTDIYRDISIRFGKLTPDFFALIPGKDLKGFQKYYGKDIPLDCSIVPNTEHVGLQNLCDKFQTQKRLLDTSHKELSEEWSQRFPLEGSDDNKSFCARVNTKLTEQLNQHVGRDYKVAGGTTGLVNFLQIQMTLESSEYEDKRSNAYYKNWLKIPRVDASVDNHLGFLQRLQDHFTAYFEFDREEIKRNVSARILVKLASGQKKFTLDEMFLEDVIRLINQKLEKGTETRQDLQRIITQAYPVCLVDEFQDTDPEQFKMFNEIYSEGGEGTGFFMIGDPKQSIYAFRGADIFSYLDVRNRVSVNQTLDDPRIFSLDTNWRSKSRLVQATNALFKEPVPSVSAPESEGDDQKEHSPVPGFLFKGIEYQDVSSCEDEPHSVVKPSLKIDGKGASSLVFIGNSDTAVPNKINKETLRRKYAKDTAARIKALLHKKTGGKLRKRGESAEPVSIKPQDIAVLVRSGTEARTVREELARKGIDIRCVYLSQKDSVFSDSEISEDLYHVLVAINEHSDKRRLKTALATPFMRGFKFSFNAVDKIEESDAALESLIEEFGAYKELWQEYGIMTALNRLLGNKKRGLFTELAKRDDSDRILTDFRHLADLLQSRGQEFGSAEQLIDWYANQLDDDSSLDEAAKRIRLESDEDLVKIVTIHVSKGLQYPIVFLPFFYMPWEKDLKKDLPLYHEVEDSGESGKLKAIFDFSSEKEVVQEKMQKESLAEDMRLLYVSITRAMYQCYVGISASTQGNSNAGVFDLTVWNHLLGIKGSRPEWPAIEQALHSRFKGSSFDEGDPVMTTELIDHYQEQASTDDEDLPDNGQGDTNGLAIVAPEKITIPKSDWQITSYSALAHGKKVRADDKGDDESAITADDESEIDEQLLKEEDKSWANNPRYTLKGSAITGNCLHGIFENYALEPSEDFNTVVEKLLSAYGLDKPRSDEKAGDQTKLEDKRKAHIRGIQQWMTEALNQPLRHESLNEFPSLLTLIESGQVIPEMDFDFAIGSDTYVPGVASFNAALKSAGLDGLKLYSDQIHGLMTGSVDLVFIHDSKVYVLDYKSNTLGKAPRFYDQEPMKKCMKESRYDLQYMIYSTAVHRYFSNYFNDRYSFDPEPSKDLSFGGVFYLFLRGMGLESEEYGRHGVWFKRPEYEHVEALDDAFRGESK